MLFRSDRKSTRLNSSHLVISYAVFCLKKKTPNTSQIAIKAIPAFTFRRPLTASCRCAPYKEKVFGVFNRLHHDRSYCVFFFFNDTATTEIYTLSLHDALPI